MSNWHIMRNGQICPTNNEAQTREEAITAAVILARYDDAEYTVSQEVYLVAPHGRTVEVRRAANGRMVERHTFDPGDGIKGELS